MNVIHTADGFLERFPGCVATIGKFDGVHRGHQQIIRQLLAQADKYSLPSVAIVIEPHPEEFFAARPQDCPPRLTEAEEKVALLQALGVDTVFLLHFDLALSRLSPQAYINEVLVRGLNVRCLIVGSDFRFGYQRAGDFQLLKSYGEQLRDAAEPGAAGASGFEVLETDSVELDGIRISSTYIRELLAAGDFQRAGEALGRPYGISGIVVKGRQLGRDLGFPTCNLALRRRNIPLYGVYACEAIIESPEGADRPSAEATKRIVYGAANIGYRPTVTDEGEAMLEVHLLDFKEDIYGAKVTVIFRKRIRPEYKFDTLSALTAQIRRDVEAVREYFETTCPAPVETHKSTHSVT